MDLKNCSQCGSLFTYAGRNICNKCLEKEEAEYKIVRRYVRDHPGASIFEVSEETDIEEEKILQFIRDGRLKSQGFKGVLECESCGQSISNGRFCMDCMAKRDNEIRGVLRHAAPGQAKPASAGKMNERIYSREKDPEQ